MKISLGCLTFSFKISLVCTIRLSFVCLTCAIRISLVCTIRNSFFVWCTFRISLPLVCVGDASDRNQSDSQGLVPGLHQHLHLPIRRRLQQDRRYSGVDVGVVGAGEVVGIELNSQMEKAHRGVEATLWLTQGKMFKYCIITVLKQPRVVFYFEKYTQVKIMF